MKNHILVLDVGTAGVKGIVFNEKLAVVSRAYVRLNKKSRGDRVEQNPLEICAASKKALRDAVRKSRLGHDAFAGMGITNQRETTILWERTSGKPVYPAIVWEDSRTRAFCEGLSHALKREIREKTGLAADPYFSGTKIRWILKNVPRARRLAAEKNLLFGTVDSWLLWNLAEKRPHVTDYTNASRTLLFNTKTTMWDQGLLDEFGIPADIVPAVQPSVGRFGFLRKDILGFSLPILAVCGDQQASLFAAGAKKGTTKVTYGTGAFVGQVIGGNFLLVKPFFTTLAAYVDRPVYALEMKVDDCGAKVQPAIGNERYLKKIVGQITRKTSTYLRRLPIRPKVVIVDGGVTQYAGLVDLQKESSGLPVRGQTIYDGTALGTAMLVRKML